jgi:deoxyadenosine/deoxycytidine kinase
MNCNQEEHNVDFKPLIWLEGGISSGKTTMARKLGELLKLRVLEEPVDANPYLELFYQDPHQYAFSMQIFLLHRRYAMQQLASYECTSASNYSGAVLDRSLSGDRVFCKLLRDAGHISALDFATYEECYAIMARSLLPPTLLVYLDVQPETAYARMKKRARGAEINVTLDYLIKLRDGYRELLVEAERGLLPWAHAIRLVRIPWDVDTVTDEQWLHTASTIRDACRQGW